VPYLATPADAAQAITERLLGQPPTTSARAAEWDRAGDVRAALPPALHPGQLTILELTAPPPKGGGFLAHAAWPSSGRPGLTRSAPAGFRPARLSITRAEFLSLGETAPHAVQV